MNVSTRVRGASRTLPQPAWTAQMVRPLADAGVGTPASFLRKEVTIGEPSGDEILRISALGLYRAFINGVRVGNDLLTPGWTSYDKRISFQTYQVGALLRQGTNVIDIWLADGWYRSQMMWKKKPIFNTWGSEIAAIAELRQGAGTQAAVLLKTDETGPAASCRSESRASISARSTMRVWKGSMPTGAARPSPSTPACWFRMRSSRWGSSSRCSLSSPGETPKIGFSTISARTWQAMSR